MWSFDLWGFQGVLDTLAPPNQHFFKKSEKRYVFLFFLDRNLPSPLLSLTRPFICLVYYVSETTGNCRLQFSLLKGWNHKISCPKHQHTTKLSYVWCPKIFSTPKKIFFVEKIFNQKNRSRKKNQQKNWLKKFQFPKENFLVANFFDFENIFWLKIFSTKNIFFGVEKFFGV